MGDLAQLPHVFDRHHHLDLERLACTCVDDCHRSRSAVAIAAKESGDFFERALRCRQSDALRRLDGEFFEPLKREGEMRTALGGGHCVDLVDDHGVDVDERAAR